MKTFEDFLKEAIAQASNTIIVSDIKEKETLHIDHISKHLIIKIENFKTEKFKTENLFRICDTYEPSNMTAKYWETIRTEVIENEDGTHTEKKIIEDNKPTFMRFLIIIKKENVDLYAFNGAFLHSIAIECLTKKLTKSGINFGELYNNFFDKEKLKKLNFEEDTWCFPLVLYKGEYEISATDDILKLIIDKEIYSFFGMDKDYYVKRMKSYD